MALLGLSGTYGSAAQRAYARTTLAIADSSIRIDTGNRIRRNGDDAASLSSATLLQAQTSTLRSTLTNSARATSLLQVAHDGLTQVRAILESLGKLASTATQTGITTRQFATLDAQFQSQKSGIDTIVAATRFNGNTLLDGSTPAPIYQVGTASSSTITLSIPSVTSASLFPAPVSLSNAANSATASTATTSAQASVDNALAKVGAYLQQLDLADATTQRSLFGVGNGIRGLLSTDIAAEQRSIDRNHLQQQTAAALIAQALGVTHNLLALVR